MKIASVILISMSFFLSGCSGCSKSGRKQRLTQSSVSKDESSSNTNATRRNDRILSGEKTTVKMVKINGARRRRVFRPAGGCRRLFSMPRHLTAALGLQCF